MANKKLNAAKEAKKDEFYTQLEDINNERQQGIYPHCGKHFELDRRRRNNSRKLPDAK